MFPSWLTMNTEHGFPLLCSNSEVLYNVWLCSATFLVLSHAAIALIYPLFIEEGRLIDHEHQRVAAFAEISSPQQLEQFQISEEQPDKVVVNLLDWQVCTFSFTYYLLFFFQKLNTWKLLAYNLLINNQAMIVKNRQKHERC